MLSIKSITEKGDELSTAIQLFKDYALELNADLCFQSFDAELADPLKKYGAPKGALILAYYNNEVAGCVALQPLQGAAITKNSHTIGLPKNETRYFRTLASSY
jgi:hypothetical protein